MGWSIDLSCSCAAGLWILFGFAAVGFVGALRIWETFAGMLLAVHDSDIGSDPEGSQNVYVGLAG